MKEALKKFLEMVSADEKLKTELEEKLAGKEPKEQKELFLTFAKEKGFELEESDLVSENMSGESTIEMEELSQVTGGKGACVCQIFGGGGGSGLNCGCLGYGQGSVLIAPGVESYSQGCCFCLGSGGGGTSRD